MPSILKAFEVIQSFGDAGVVAVLSGLTRVAANVQYAVTHILKFRGEKIVEM